MKKNPDWNDTLKEGGTDAVRTRYDNVIRLAPEPTPPLKLSEWLTRVDLKEPHKLLGSLLTTTCRVLIAGPTGLGKTLFGLAVAFAVIRNNKPMRRSPGALTGASRCFRVWMDRLKEGKPRGRLRRGVICHYSSLSGSTLVAAKRRF